MNIILSRDAYITAYGRYDDSKSNKYIEWVERSYTNPNHNQCKDEIDYEIINDIYLKLTYSNRFPNSAETINEVWIRIPYGNLFEMNNVAM